MKRILTLFLAMIMIVSLCACGKKTADSTNESTTVNTESSSVGTEATAGSAENPDETASATDGTDPTEKPTEQTKPTESTKPTSSSHKHSYSSKETKAATCTEKGIKTFTCSCGSNYTESISAKGHSWGEWVTTKEPTTSSEGASQRKCNNCSATENKSIAKIPAVEQTAHYVSHELVGIERPKTYYVDGVDVLTLARGENWVQVCDTIKIKVNMSDSGSNFEVKKWFTNTGYSYEKKGNEVWITPDGTTTSITVLIRVIDENGSQKDIKIAEYEVYKSNANLSEEQEVNQMLKHYGQSLGMRYTTNGPEVANMNYTRAIIYDNFKVEAFRTIKKWKNDGYTVFSMAVYAHCFDGVAGK